ncbi:TIR domain-containing protein [Clostridium akagii]|uniref:TIR domain-containing protein n=1 Tax=Clostridium akagii TaxID=91623 RepID=UPI000479AC3E|nr:TIR domain-containing protein [Clostridium akagii]
MKVFISHKKEDELVALDVFLNLKELKVDAYLDLIDSGIEFKGELLTEHIKRKLNECTDILVVLTEKTKLSWWVPFEIGMASQKELPIVNYLSEGTSLPDYLEYWPRLKNAGDLSKYIAINKKQESDILLEKAMGSFNKYASYENRTEKFYKDLKAVL